MDGFPFVYRDTVRFRDLDALGHVNNAVFLSYMESARFAWFVSVGAGDAPYERLILARAEVEVGVRPSRLGTKSFELEYEVRADGRLAAEGKSVLVGFDYERGASMEIPAEWREFLQPEVAV